MEKGCSCKTGCNSKRCGCRKNNVMCNKHCLCKQCENIQVDKKELPTDDGNLKKRKELPISEDVTVTDKKHNTKDVRACLQDIINIIQNQLSGDIQEQQAQQSIIHSVNSYLQLLEFKEKQTQIFLKPRPKERKGVNADEIYDLTKELNQIPSSKWTEEQIQRAMHRLAEVSGFFMRGSPEARQALTEFHKNWIDFVSSRCDVKAMMDPEIIVFDVPWVMTPTWVSDANRANAYLPAPAVNVPVPPLPPPPPGGYPVGTPPGGASYIFTHPGPLQDVHHFAGFMQGKNFAATTGYWRISTLAPPIYY